MEQMIENQFESFGYNPASNDICLKDYININYLCNWQDG